MSSVSVARARLAAPSGSGSFLGVVIAALTFGGSLALLAHGGIDAVRVGADIGASHRGSGGLEPIAVVLAAGSTVPLIAWRRYPLGVFVTTASASALLAGMGYRLELTLGPAAALYLLAASRDREAPWTWRYTGIAAGLLVAYLGASAAAQQAFPWIAFLHTILLWAAAWFAGERTRLRREHIADLRQRAVRTEREAERERLLAAAEERARIARDLHDSAGHAISVIAVRAGAARLGHHDDPDRSLRALAAIEEVARQTVDEIDHIVGSLRGPAGGSVEAPASLASLDTLIAQHRAAGLVVTVSVLGQARTINGAADQATFRILQEALTNAARHGAGRAGIELTYGGEAVELTVTNPVPAQNPGRSSGGHGLIGMRERAALLGGSLNVERSNEVFSMRARIPYGDRGA